MRQRLISAIFPRKLLTHMRIKLMVVYLAATIFKEDTATIPCLSSIFVTITIQENVLLTKLSMKGPSLFK